MSQTIKLKRSAVAGKVPTTSSLDLGEIALNTNDGKAYLKKNDGSESIQTFVVTDSLTTGSIVLTGQVSASVFSGSFFGNGTGLTRNMAVTGSDVFGNQFEDHVSVLHFDSDTGINVSASAPNTAFIKLGSHFRDFFVDGSATIVATGSDQMDIIANGGLDISTSLTDTNGNGVSKELIFAVDATVARTGSNVFTADQTIEGKVTSSTLDTSGNAIIRGDLDVLGDINITGEVDGHISVTPVASDSDNSNGVVIQDLTFDGFGHTRTLGTVNLDDRYFTETEADNRFVNVTGDSISGSLIVSASGATNDLQIGDNKLFVSASGNVGIGTTSPANDLTVNGDIGYTGVIGQGSIYGNTGNASFATMQLYNPATGFSTFNNQSYGYYFNTGGGTKVTILNNGNVGIGTTSPSSKLHIVDTTTMTSGQSSIEVLKLQRLDSGGDIKASTEGHVSMWATDSNSNNEWARISWLNDNTSDIGAENEGSLHFWTNNGGTLTRQMMIDHQGNVGIGTTSPSRTLHIEDSSVAAIQLENTSEADSFIDFMNPSRTFRVGYDDSTDLFKVAITNFNDNSLVVDSSGNVGIGTTSPARELSIGDGTGSPNIQLLASTVGNSRIEFGDADDSDAGEIQYVHSDNTMRLTTSGSEAMRIDSSGNVLVGSTSYNNDNVGVGLGASGFLYATRDNTLVSSFNRLTSDGDIVDFRKDGSIVGSIGCRGTDLSIGNYDTGLNFWDAGNAIIPENISAGTTRHNAIDLGANAVRFKNLYLGGTGYIDGDLTVGGIVTAQEFHTEFVSASIIYQSGSTKFGDTNDDNHNFTGSIDVSGSGAVLVATSVNDSVPMRVKSPSQNVSRIGFESNGSTSDYHVSIGAAGTNLVAYTGNSERMRIDSSGNVGIGTTDIEETLTIAKTGGGDGTVIGLRSDASFSQFEIATKNSQVDWGLQTVGGRNMYFSTNAQERMRIDSSGNVKIGNSTTATPSTNADDLVIDKGASESGITIMSTAAAAIRFGDAASSSIGVLEYNHNSDYMRMIVNSSERMRIDSSGNVGIGTTSPTTISGYSSLEINNATNGAILDLSQASTMRGRFIATSTTLALETSGTIPILFQPAGSEAMRINSSGNVGIGVTDPGQSLVIGGGTNGRARMKVTSGAGNFGKFEFSTDSSSTASTAMIAEITANIEGVSPLTSNLVFSTNGGDSLNERMRINSSGNVGIGTTSPSDKLTVEGTDAKIKINNTTSTKADLVTLDLTGTVIGSGAGNERAILLGKDGNSSRQAKIAYSQGGSNGQLPSLSFFTGDSIDSLDERMRIDSSGNVGIGTDSPVTNLHIEDSSGSTLRLTTLASGGTSVIQALGYDSLNVSRFSSAIDFESVAGSGTANGHIIFSTYPSNSKTERMRIDSSGRLVFNPASITDNNNSIFAHTNGYLYIEGGTNGFILQNNAGGDCRIRIEDANAIRFETNSSEAMRIDSSGNVLMGTTNTTWQTVAGLRYFNGSSLTVTRDGGESLNLNRLSSNGDIAVFRKDSTTVGSISADADGLGIGSTDVGLLFLTVGQDRIIPRKVSTTAVSNNLVDLGDAGSQFKDLYLGGHAKIATALTASGLIYPTSDGTVNQVIATDGNGNLSFISPGAATAFPYIGNAVITGSLIVSASGATNDLQIGDDKLFVSASGNVGIGTTSPLTLLHVGGGGSSNVPITFAPSTGGNVEFRNTSSTGTFTFTNQNGVQERVRIDASGNVGIGTTSPGGRLQLDHTGAQGATALILNRTGTGGANGVISFKAEGVSKSGIGTNFNVGDANGNLEFLTNGTSTRMVIDSSGNVGIGTTSPDSRLEIESNGSSNSVVTIDANDARGASRFALLVTDSDPNSRGSVRISTTSGPSLTTSGNVGIGTTSPSAKLHVSGTLADNREFQVGDNYLVVTGSNGNVGIGTDSPATKLSVGSENHISPDDTDRILAWYSPNTEVGNSSHALTIGFDNNATDHPRNVGLSLFNNSTTANTFSPALTFGGLSTSGNYMNGAAAIAAQLPANTNDDNFRGGNLIFYTQGTTLGTRGLSEKMRIDASGNVGIGTSSPSVNLHISSSANDFAQVRVEAASDGYDSSVAYSQAGTIKGISGYDDSTDTVAIKYGTFSGGGIEIDSNGQVYFKSSNDYKVGLNDSAGTNQWWLKSYTNGDFSIHENMVGDQFTIQAGGNVGIGTTSPAYTLDISGDSSSGVVAIRNAANGRDTLRSENAAGTRTFNIGTDSSGHGIVLVRNSSGTTTNYIAGSGNSYFNSGNVGIGTTSPSFLLHVQGTPPATNGALINARNSAATTSNTTFGGIFFNSAPGYDFSIGKSNVNSDTTLSFRNGNDGVSLMDITPTGNVGIGTSSPLSLLTLSDDSPTITLRDATSTDYSGGEVIGSIDFVTTEGSWGGGNNPAAKIEVKAANQYAATQIGFYTSTNPDDVATEKMTIDESGNVGIGTTSPYSKLELNQSAAGAPLRLRSESGNSGNVGMMFSVADNTVTTDAYQKGAIYFQGDGTGNAVGDLVFAVNNTLSSTNVSISDEKLRIKRTGEITMDGDLTVGGKVTAQEFHTEFVSASIVYQSGSTKFGDTSDDVHSFSGSLRVTGSGDHYFTNGNVGIGTSSPGATLDIEGELHLYDNGSTSQVHSQNNPLYLTSAADLRIHAQNTGGDIYLDANGFIKLREAGADVLTIDGGNVGIGTTSPSTKLEVAGDIKSTGDITIDNSSGDPFLRLKTTAQQYVLRIDQSDSEKFQIRDTTNSVSRLTIDTSGNVGIGTTSPANKLHVAVGSSAIALNEYNNGAIIWLDGSNGDFTGGDYFNLYAPNETRVSLGYIGGEVLTVTSGSNVGIGTTTPDTKLHVFSTSADPAKIITNSVTNSSLLIGNTSTGTATLILDGSNGDATGADYLSIVQNNDLTANIYTQVNAGVLTLGSKGTSNAITIDGSNVGIGTTSPSKTLHVLTTAEAALFQGSATWGTAVQIDATGTGGRNYQIQSTADGAGEGGGKFIIVDKDASSATRLAINSSGNVGIGTTSPVQKLHIVGGQVRLDSNTGGFYQYNTSGTFRSAFYDNGTVTSIFGDGDGSNPAITINSGNVGIGNTSPGKKLDVTGTSRITGEASFGNDVLLTNNAYVYSNNGGSGVRAGWFLDGTNQVIKGFTAAAERMRIDSSGNIFASNSSNNLVIGNSSSGGVYLGGGNSNTTLISLQVGSSERMRIDSSGRVGIGDVPKTQHSNVTDSLNVGSHLTFQRTKDTYIASNFYYNSSDFGTSIASGWSPLYLQDVVNGKHQWYNGTASATGADQTVSIQPLMTIDSSGNVGIGTTAMSSFEQVGANLLVLGSGAGSQGMTIYSGTAGVGSIAFADGTTTTQEYEGLVQYNHGTNSMAFYSNHAEAMRIDSSGNVGIGTTSPNVNLHVANAGSAYIKVERTTAGSEGQITLGATTSDNRIYSNGVDSSTGRDLLLTFGGVDNHAFNSNGKVGIGTTSPDEKLEVYQGNIKLGTATNTTSKLIFERSNANRAEIYVNSLNALQLDVASSERMRIDSSGNVGIGTTSPGTKLEVNGTATVTSLVETSTRKLKENIETLEDQSSIVDSLQPVSYTWKESKEEDFGLVAEDVADIAPHLVSRDEDGNPTGIKYSKLSVLLLDVVQRQSTLIEDLNERITKLENERGN